MRQRSGRLFPRSFTVQCSRPQAELDLIKTEFSNAAKIATYAQQNLDSPSASTYTSAFISKDLLDAGIIGQLKASYGNGANINATNPPTDYKLKVTCDDTHHFCMSGYYASMSDDTHTMNLCSAWFSVAGTPAGDKNNPDLISTSDLLAGCTGNSPKYANLQDFWPGRAQALLHEWTHTTYFTGTTERTIDYAYGVQKCLDLAAGSRVMPASRERDRKGTPICPDKANPQQPGVCNPDFSIDNADTLAIIAGGLWYSDKAQCNRAIPIGLTAAPPPSRKRQAPGGELILDPPYNGDGFDAGSCSDPVDNCCGDCSGDNTPTSALTSSLPSATALAPPPPPPPPPPYATGTCSFHLTETQDCDTNYDNNLYGNVVMKDNNKAIIGSTVNDDDHPIGYGMNNGHPYSFSSKLPNPLIITGEHENDYVQFTYGSLSWQSKTPNGGGSCTVGGWNPRDGPVCHSRVGDQNAVRLTFHLCCAKMLNIR